MATMIPSFIDERTASGEKQLFQYLQSGPDNWVVFHQLDLTPYNSGRQTEIDFVVVIPELGILCIEIKSHETIRFDFGKWYPDTGVSPITRSPFKQSSEATFAFINHLKGRGDTYRRIPIYNAVIFPRSIFDLEDNLFFQAWNFYDKRRINRLIQSERFHVELKSGLEKSIIENANFIAPLNSTISSKTIDSLKGICAPIQKVRLSKRDEIKLREEEALSKLRIQQKNIIGQILDTKSGELLNPRCLIKGPAGTGKTWIAIELAKILADKGLRVGLISYNKNVGDWMIMKVAEEALRPNLVTGSAFKILLDILKLEITSGTSDGYWNSQFYDDAEEALTNPEVSNGAVFDYLVIDEAQDILSLPRLWNLLPQLLVGGLVDGQYCLLGDFDYQLFGNRDSLVNSMDSLRKDFRVAQMNIRENCRNYKYVGKMALCVSGLSDSVYDGYRREGGSLNDIEIEYFDTSHDQQILLSKLITKFINMGYGYEEIIVLSFNTDDKSSAKEASLSGSRLKPYRNTLSRGVPYASVNSFKGLEAKIVILTDVIIDDSEFRRNQLYTAITRSTESVVMLCSNSYRTKLMSLLR